MSLLLPQTAAADPIVAFADDFVTWDASGVIDGGFTTNPGIPIPPVGTPYTLSMTFNPQATYPTFGASASECVSVDASGSFNIGGTSFAVSGQGSTHAQAFGGTLCVGASGGFTEFVFGLPPIPESPWDASPILLVASYSDLFVQDAFPDVPMPAGPGSLWIQAGFLPDALWGVRGPFAPVALDVEQPAPIPEPGTLTLFALGLAAAARKMRRKEPSI